MLTEQEKRGVAELLEFLSLRDLVSLAQTVTNRLIVPETSLEAVQAIILHSSNVLELLKRRKITRELLFKYLNSRRVALGGQTDKASLAAAVLRHWGSPEEEANSLQLMLVDEDNSLDGGPAPPPPAPTPSRNASHTSLCSLDLSRDGLPPPLLMMSATSSSSFTSFTYQQTTFSFVNQVVHSSLSQAQCQEMADKFVSWYYQLINSCADFDNPDFGPRHFWPDASARVEIISSNGEAVDSLLVSENGAEVCDMLKGVVRRHRVQYNPNLCDEGVRGRLEPHGLVLVLACGTLHTSQTVCGVFEQVFGLIKDPSSDNNWKIKHTEARLVAKSVMEQTSLEQSSLMAVAFS